MRTFGRASYLLTLRSVFSSRAVTMRLQFSAARARAIASPMPRVAPVISATWPWRRVDLGAGGKRAILRHVGSFLTLGRLGDPLRLTAFLCGNDARVF